MAPCKAIRATVWAGALMGMCVGLSGCRSTAPATPTDAQQINAITVSAREYDAIFEAATYELRQSGMTLARRDYRFGVLTTEPTAIPTAIEVWQVRHPNTDLAGEATLGELRHQVTVTLEPREIEATAPELGEQDFAQPGPVVTERVENQPIEPEEFDSPESEVSVADGAMVEEPIAEESSTEQPTEIAEGEFMLRVEAVVQRASVPVRRLSGTAGRSVFADLQDTPEEYKQRGIESTYWVAVGRDESLERELLHKIIRRSVVISSAADGEEASP